MGENAFWSAELEGQPNEEDVALCDQPDVQDDQEGQGYNASRPGGSADGDEDDEEEALGGRGMFMLPSKLRGYADPFLDVIGQ
jgi:hypothetical protein